MDQQITLMYLFFSSVDAKTQEEGLKRAKPIFLACKRFAQSIGSHIMYDPLTAMDGRMEFRIVFDIKGTEYSVLEKVAALFSFATLFKFRLTNQFYYPEQGPKGPLR